MMKPAILAGAGAAAMLIGYAGGRYAQPARVEVREKVVEKTVEVAAKERESANVETTQADIRSVTHWRVRYVAKPDGTVVSTASGDSGQSSDQATHHESTKRAAEIRYVDREKTVEKVVIKEAARPSWGLAVGAGIRRGPAPVYRGELSRRLLGPLWLGAYGSTAGEAGVMARLEF